MIAIFKNFILMIMYIMIAALILTLTYFIVGVIISKIKHVTGKGHPKSLKKHT